MYIGMMIPSEAKKAPMGKTIVRMFGFHCYICSATKLTSRRIRVSECRTISEPQPHPKSARQTLTSLTDCLPICATTPMENPDFIQIAQYISPQYQGVVALLIDELGLITADVCHASQNYGQTTGIVKIVPICPSVPSLVTMNNGTNFNHL